MKLFVERNTGQIFKTSTPQSRRLRREGKQFMSLPAARGILRFITVFILWAALHAGPALSATIAPYAGTKWGDPTLGVGATVSWSLVEGSGAEIDDLGFSTAHAPLRVVSLADAFGPAIFDVAKWAFDQWATVADLRFTQSADGGEAFGAVSTPDIRIWGADLSQFSGVVGLAYRPGPGRGGDVLIDVAGPFANVVPSSTPKRTGLETTLAHEIGHALGLRHVMEPGALMSATFAPGTLIGESIFSEPDIAGIQRIYGPAPSAVVPIPSAFILMLTSAAALRLASRGQKARRTDPDRTMR